jgi:hypothetical protein
MSFVDSRSSLDFEKMRASDSLFYCGCSANPRRPSSSIRGDHRRGHSRGSRALVHLHIRKAKGHHSGSGDTLRGTSHDGRSLRSDHHVDLAQRHVVTGPYRFPHPRAWCGGGLFQAVSRLACPPGRSGGSLPCGSEAQRGSEDVRIGLCPGHAVSDLSRTVVY